MGSVKTPFGHDAFRRSCPSHTVLDMLASKWVYLTVCALRRGRLRNGELARKLEGITPKMLTQTLRVSSAMALSGARCLRHPAARRI